MLREKLIAIQEFKKFPVIYGPEMFISNVTTQSKIKQILNLLVVMEYNLLWRLSGSIFKALTAWGINVRHLSECEIGIQVTN